MNICQLKSHLFVMLLIIFGGIGCVSGAADVSAIASKELKGIKNIVALAEQVHFTLTPPPLNLLSTTHTHLIETTFNGKTQQFIAQTEYANKQISLAAISAAGMPLFDFVWHKDKPLMTNQYIPLPSLNINYIIADLQWVNWPLAQLESALSGNDIQVVEKQLSERNSDNTSHWIRTVKQHNNVIMTIEKTNNRYHLENVQRKYSLNITDMSKEE